MRSRPATPPSHRPARLLAGALAVLGLAALLTAGPPQPAAATPAPAGRAVRLLVDTVEPAAPSTGATLRVTGRITNTGRQTLRDLEVRLRLSSGRLGSRGELAAVLAGETTSRDGEVVVTEGLADLGRGETAGFDLSRATAELSRLTGFGVYVLGVEVLASRDAGFGRVAIERLPLPWADDAEQLVPTGYTMVWPLISRPVRLADGTFSDDSLAAEIEPTGRLTRLVATGARLGLGGGLVWAIDPDLVAAVADMADGYEVLGADGRRVPGGGTGLAVRWLGELRAATSGQPVLALPYGDVDITALVRGDLGGDVDRALSIGRTTLVDQLPAASLVTDAVWPPDGRTTRATLAALRRADISTVLLDSSALPPSADMSYTPTGRADVPTGSGRLTGLLSDPALTDLLRSTADPPGTAAQRVVGELAMIASELPSGPGRTVVLAPPRRFNPAPAFLDRLAAAIAQARWLEPVSFGELVATPVPEVERAGLDYPREAREAELPKAYLAAVDDTRASVAIFSSVLTEPTAFLPDLERSILRLESSWWRGRTARTNRMARERDYLAALRAQVRVLPGNFTFSSRRGTLALTIENGLDQPVEVFLRLSPQTTRLRLAPVEPLRLDPNSKTQVEVSAVAVAPGPVTVEAGLRTPGGAPYGQPVQLRITITEYGTVALYITLGAAAVLFLAAGARLVRRARNARRGGSAARGEPAQHPAPDRVRESAPDSAPDSAQESVP